MPGESPSPEPSEYTRLSFEELLQDDCSVVILVVCCVKECQHAVPTLVSQQLEGLVLVLEFAPIKSLKFIPPRPVRVLPESSVKDLGGRDLLEPEIKFGMLLRQVSRPKPLDKNPKSILNDRSVVNAFHLNHGRETSQ